MSDGLLIVNADDWGSEESKSAAIHIAFESGAISSASAMVYMEDSDRAAALGLREQFALGLHLNLTQPFSDPRTPPAVRARQERLLEHFENTGRRRRTFDPRVRSAVRAAIADQLARYHELYGHVPDHVDGHEHVHICLDVLLALPRGLKIRPGMSSTKGTGAAGVVGAAREALIRARLLRAPSKAFGLGDLWTAPGDALERVLSLSRNESVEIMCHPDRPADKEALVSDRWHQALASSPLGTFAQLGA